MGLFDHMRIHESGIGRPPDSPTTPNPTFASSPCAPTTFSTIDTDAADFTCPHCDRKFTSRIGLVGHLRIHCTGTVNQCLEHQPTLTALDSTAHIALARTAWTYSATCASRNTCGRQPPAEPHHHTLHPSLPHHRKHPTATSHASGKCASRLCPYAASAARAAGV
ncbi:hypothetical protein SprV_0100405200 [Sparganum proliferum]